MTDTKIILLDSNSLINRAFHALPPLAIPSGLYTNAIYGYLTMLNKLITEEKPTHICAVFDAKAKTFRHKLSDAYKATRKPMPDELAMQVPVLQDLLRKMGITVISMEGYEADDILGTLAKNFSYPTIIVSGDRDCLQLVDDTTTVFHTKKGISEVIRYTPQRLAEEGFTPPQIIEYKGLAGDSSDNISGCPGVGEKTAKDLIAEYQTIDNLYENIEQIKGKLKEKLIENKDVVYLSRTLATIDTNVPVNLTLEQIVYAHTLTNEAVDMLKYLQFKPALIEKFSKNKIDVPKEISVDKNIIPDKGVTSTHKTHYSQKQIAGTIVKIHDLDDLRAFTAEIKVADPVILDLLPNRIIVGQGTKLSETEISTDLLGIGFDLYETLQVIKPLLSNKYVKIIYDVKRSMHTADSCDMGIEPPYDDILLMAYLNNNTITIKNETQLIESYGYTADNPFCAFSDLNAFLLKQIENKSLKKLYDEVERPLIPVLFRMEKSGFCIDKSILASLNVKYSEEIDNLIQEIFLIAGEEFNINSTKQLSTILFDRLGLKPTKKTKTGYSVDADTLEELEHPIINAILRYRELMKLKSTYIDGMKEVIDPATGKVHTCFNQCITTTGRLSSTEPNLQNIPVRKTEGREIRKMFVPSPGCILVTSDYSQIELRLLAHFSEEPNLLSEYKKNGDIHALTASKIFNVPFELVTKEMRSSAKAVNFGIIYGISVFGLAKNARVSRPVAKRFIEQYFETYKNVKTYMDNNVKLATQQGYLRSICGRIRYFPELSAGTKFNVRAFGERAAMNMPLQGSASDIIKIAMIKVDERLRQEKLKAKLILQVHDELIVDTPLEEENKVKEILKDCMENAVSLIVPLTVNVASGKNWYEAK